MSSSTAVSSSVVSSSLIAPSPVSLISSAGLQSAMCFSIPLTSTCDQLSLNPWATVLYILLLLVSQMCNLQCSAYFSKQSSLWQGSHSAHLNCASHTYRAWLLAPLIPLKGARFYQKTMSRGLFHLCRLPLNDSMMSFNISISCRPNGTTKDTSHIPFFTYLHKLS